MNFFINFLYELFYMNFFFQGRAMTITIVGSDSNGRDGGRDRRDGGFRDRSPRGGGNRRNNSDRNNRDGDRPRRGGRGGGRGGGNRREKKEDITQEQLDAEMDDYLNKRNDEVSRRIINISQKKDQK